MSAQTANAKTTDKTKPTKPSTEIAIEGKRTELEIIDDILTNKLSGEINGYRNLLTDTTVFGTWTQRQSALVQMERQVIPADSDNPADVEAAEFIKSQIEGVGFDRILKAMHWGVYYGYGVSEMMWDVIDGKVTIADILVRDRGKFKFDKDKRLMFVADNSEKPMPDSKFWSFSAGGDTTDNPYGLGIAHYLFWAVLFKKSNVKFWLLGLEKAATSVPHVQYDPNTKDPTAERNKALQAGIALKNGSAIATAKGTLVELLKGVSGTEDYETLCRYMDEAIALVVLGQVMTSQAVGGQYKADVQNQVKEDIIKADADLLCSSFNNTVIKWLTAWNFPNANPPKLWLLTESEVDNLATAGMYEKMAKVGYRPKLETVENEFGGEWEAVPTANPAALTDEGTKLPIKSSSTDKPTQKANDFAEGSTINDVTKTPEADTSTPVADRIIDQLADELDPIQSAWIDEIKSAIEQAESLETIRENLDKLAEILDFDGYARVFSAANVAAKLAGMVSAKAEDTDNDE